MHMRTTLILKDDLYEKARQATGIQEKTRLIHLGLEALVRQAALNRLAKLKGVFKNARAPHRRKSF